MMIEEENLSNMLRLHWSYLNRVDGQEGPWSTLPSPSLLFSQERIFNFIFIVVGLYFSLVRDFVSAFACRLIFVY